MGFLDLFTRKAAAPVLKQLPSGSFTIDAKGRIATSTLPRSFPEEDVRRIGQAILAAFREAQAAQLPPQELVIEYLALKITARELRGGAMVFLVPHGLVNQAP